MAQAMLAKTELIEQRPTVLLLAEPDLHLSELVGDFLQSNGFAVISRTLDEDFFDTAKQLASQSFHKAIVLYGFEKVDRSFYHNQLFVFLDELQTKQGEAFSITLFSNISTNLVSLLEIDHDFQLFQQSRIDFVQECVTRYPATGVFVIQDLVLQKQVLGFPLLHFFQAFQSGFLVDLQSYFYLQDEESVFDFTKTYLLKPHKARRILLRGKKIPSSKLAEQLGYLYEQYFQKKVPIKRFSAQEYGAAFLREYTVVANTKASLENLLDLKIRNIVSLLKSQQNKEISLEKLEALNYKVLTEKSQNKAKKPSPIIRTQRLMTSFRKPVLEPLQSLSVAASNDGLTQKIEQLFSTQRTQEKTHRQETNVNTTASIVQQTKKRKLVFAFGFSIAFLGIVTLSLFGLFSMTQEMVKQQLVQATKSDLKLVKNIDNSIIYSIFNTQFDYYQKVFSLEQLSSAADTMRLHDSLLKFVETREAYEAQSFDLYRKTLQSGVEVVSVYEVLLSTMDIKIQAEKDFNAYLMDLNLDLYEDGEKEVWMEVRRQSQNALQASLQAREFIAVWRDLVLREQRSVIAVVLQDRSELRSGGGLITELAVFSFERGTMLDYQLFNAEDLGNRVYGHREASEEIQKVLGESLYHLRDANWSADFTAASQDVNWFMTQALGYSPDLIVGLNTKAIEGLLKGVGEITLEDGSRINSNSYVQFLREGSVQDYGKAGEQTTTWRTHQAFIKRLQQLSNTEFSQVVGLLSTLLNQREVTLFSTHAAIQQVQESLVWSGKRLETVCPVEFQVNPCFPDMIWQIENNAGFNKVGDFITRDIQHDIGITSDFIRHRRSITWENQSPNSLWPLGEYRFFLTIQLPKQALLEKIELDGELITQAAYSLKQMEEYQELGLLVHIDAGKKANLLLRYVLPNEQKGSFAYAFLDQKQPGILHKETAYRLVFEDTMLPRLIAPLAGYEDKTIQFSNHGDDNFVFAIDFVALGGEKP